MPEEEHKNIEDALKAYAKQRRDDAGRPLDMPSHTRAVLQREIAQRAAGAQPKPAPRPWFEPLVALWPRLAVGVAAVATVSIAVFVLTDIGKQAKPPMELAQVESQSQSQSFLKRDGKESDSAQKAEETVSEARRLAVAQNRVAGSAGRSLEEGLKAADKLGAVRTASNWGMTKEKAVKAAPTGDVAQAAAKAAVPELEAMEKLDSVRIASRTALAKATPEISAAAETKPQAVTTAPMPIAAPVLATKPASTFVGVGVTPAPTEPLPAAPMPALAPTDASKTERADTTRLITAASSNMTPLSQRLRFAQVADDRDAAPAKQLRQQQPQAPQVLASFQLEQTGDRVVITDADGSVYEGRIQLASAAQQQVAMERRVSRARLSQMRAAAPRQVMTQAGEFVWKEKDAAFGKRLESGITEQQLYFTAIGTNRSVNQRVLVSGVLSSPAHGTLAYGSAASGERMTFEAAFAAAKLAPATSPAPSAASRSNVTVTEVGQIVLAPGSAAGPVPAAPQASAQIEGTLRLGDAPEIELNAVGVGP